MPENIPDLIWLFFVGACSVLLAGINLFLYHILTKLTWVDKFMHRWRKEEMAAINEIQGRCAYNHPSAPDIRHRLSNND